MSSVEISPNLEKIESFFKNRSYQEVVEFTQNFNKTLSVERRHRLPFLDPQTNVAQNHSNLFMSERQRMPGFRAGQIYSYPSHRWRKSRRQYLDKFYRFDLNISSILELPRLLSTGNTKSKDHFRHSRKNPVK